MLPRLVMILGLVAITILGVADANAEKRVALVVGNATYTNAAVLRNPRNDATDVAAVLKNLGFDVIVGLDLDQQQFATTVDRFARQLDDADVALFFYAGHGLQINDKNYLVSVNARLNSEFLVSSETIELDAIVNLMESKVPVNLVFLDACRNNPLAENLRKNLVAMKRGAALGRGLARIEPTRRDTLVAFAAAPGQEAADGSDRNSPFTSALLKYLPKPNLEVSVMLKYVSADVGQSTHNMQRPQQLSDMTRTFYFANSTADGSPKYEASLQDKPSSLPSARRNAATNDDDRELDIAFWNSAQAANDCEAMRAYQQRFPKGVFITLAAIAERRLCPSRHVTVLEAAPGGESALGAPPSGPPGGAAAVLQRPAPPVPATPAPPQLSERPAPSPPPALIAPQQPALGATAPASPPPANPQTAFITPTFTFPPSAQRTDQPSRDCAYCPEMVSIPAGTFDMGSTDDPMEGPVHRVTVKAFAIGRYPVKVGEWKQCAAAKVCRYEPAGDDDLPVYNVSWDDAQQYVSWLSRTTNAKYRLPTEAEWEYAARGRTATKYWWGNQPAAGKAGCKGCGSGYVGEQPMKVGLFAANGFGLFDMTGSIDQWVSDCWNRNYTGAPRDGTSWDRPSCRQHVLRGGSWKNDVSYSRTSSRDSYDTDVRYPTHGLRVVRTIQE